MNVVEAITQRLHQMNVVKSFNQRLHQKPFNFITEETAMMNVVNSINQKLHEKPFEFIIDGLYWWFILCFVCLPASIVQLLMTGYNVYQHFWGAELKDEHVTGLDGDATVTTALDQVKKRLGIVITGCDSGFGKELAIQLLESKQGFVVFCGCLMEESMEQFKQYESQGAVPIKMDVTSDTEVQAAANVVSDWLLHNPSGEERHLLALVNNAGISIPGLVDWLEISDFQKVMDVNYFGVIRCVKAFQPIFKAQASALEAPKETKNDEVEEEKKDEHEIDSTAASTYSYYPDGRIINVNSVAGIFAPGQYGVAYSSSKHALEALNNNLRQEMSMFNVKVIGIHPGLHGTPMLQKYHEQSQNIIQKLSNQKRQEYGETFINAFLKLKVPPAFESSMVIEKIVDAIALKDPPIQNLVGLDAKYVWHFFSKLPTWLSFGIFDKLLKSGFKGEEEYVPKIMMDKKKEIYEKEMIHKSQGDKEEYVMKIMVDKIKQIDENELIHKKQGEEEDVPKMAKKEEMDENGMIRKKQGEEEYAPKMDKKEEINEKGVIHKQGEEEYTPKIVTDHKKEADKTDMLHKKQQEQYNESNAGDHCTKKNQ